MENTKYKLTVLTIAIFTLVLLHPSVNHAASVNPIQTITGSTAKSAEGLGNFVAELVYSYISPTGAEFDGVLMNTSPASNMSAAPLGNFNVGTASGGNFLGIGSLGQGIPVGGKVNLGFGLTGSNLNKLNASSFTRATSDSGEFVAASSTKGFDTGGGSHKAPDSVVSVPEPSILLLLVSGLAGLFYMRKKAL